MRYVVTLWSVAMLCACGGGAPDDHPTGSRANQPQAGEPVSVGSDPWEAARKRGIEFRALGQEPGWYLEIDEGTSMRLVYDYGEREATTPVPAAVVNGRTTTYDAKTDAHHLSVVIDERPCSDVMSGLRFPRTVTVSIDGRTLSGCGQAL